jgi:FkbM family methyltransferase
MMVWTRRTKFHQKTLDDDIFVDIETNVGLFSLIASQVVGNEGLVISFEPAPTTLIGYWIISLNNLNNIRAINCGLSDELRVKFLYFW